MLQAYLKPGRASVQADRPYLVVLVSKRRLPGQSPCPGLAIVWIDAVRVDASAVVDRARTTSRQGSPGMCESQRREQRR